MQIVALENGKYQFLESYKGLDGKRHRVSVTKENKTRATQKQAYNELQKKIEIKLQKTNYKKIDYYIKEFLKYKKHNVDERTYYVYGHVLYYYLDKEILINNLNSRLLELKLNELRKKFSVAKLQRDKTLMNTFFKYVQRYFHEELYLNIEFKKTKEDLAKEKLKESNKFIDTNELKDLINKIEHEVVRDIAIVQVYTGLRIGEVLALSPKDILVETSELNVNKTIGERGEVKQTTKTVSSMRVIKISDYVMQILLKHASSKKRIFDICYMTVNRHLREAGNLTSHKFRHTHVVLLAEKNLSSTIASRRLGHATTKTTDRIYSHISEKMKKKELDTLNELDTF